MTRILLLLLPIFIFASTIKVEKTAIKPFGKMVQTNAKITQLSNQKQEIVSRLSGHLEAYFVKAGEYVKKGDRVALIESMELSKMSAEYLALVKQEKASLIQKNTSMKLNKKGLSSQNDLNSAIISLQEIRSKINALASQLKSLGIDYKRLKEATDRFSIYAHADGVVGEITAPLHSNIDAQTLIMKLVNQSSYYAVAYLSVDDAMLITKDTKGWLSISKKSYPCSFVQLLPQIDAETQRAKVLFSIDNTPLNLLLGAFNEMDISIAPYKNAIMIKKSALSLFQGEWVVFVENEHHDEDEQDNDEEHHDEVPYQAKVVEIIDYVGDEVAIRGLKENVEYVSEGVYFVKSMMLKSSLGEHGH